MQIETERLTLREFVDADWRAMLAYNRDPRYGRFYDAKEMDEARVRELLGWFLGWQSESPRWRFQMAIEIKAQGRLIGTCGLRVRRLVDFGSAGAAFEADIGYGIAPDFWGQGYATEAVRALVQFGFKDLGLHRVWAYALAENEPSWRVLERLGLKREGRLRGTPSCTAFWRTNGGKHRS